MRVIGILRLRGTKAKRNTSENSALAAGADLLGTPAATHVSIIYFLVSADFDFVAAAVSSLAS